MVFDYRTMGLNASDGTEMRGLPERFEARPNAIIMANTALRRASSADLVCFTFF